MGERIRRLRKRCGLTQVEMAKKIGLAQQNLVSHYETGRLKLNAEMVARFAQALGVTCDEIIGYNKAGSVPESAQKDLNLSLVRRMNKIQEMPLSKRRAILRTLDMLIRGYAE